jgi:uncharacterized protein YecE (DUF72 family)
MLMTRIHVGTSGWHYKHWLGNFYPPDLEPSKMLPHYLRSFRTVEINNSFYRLPPRETFEQWRRSTPADFNFAVKASRYLTHMKKLKDPEEPIARFFDSVAGLGRKLSVVLFQLPPAWKLNLERFEHFLNALPKGYRYTVEFREKSWLTGPVYSLLEQHNIAFCIYELEYFMSPVITTADFVYVRLHGPGLKYQGSYSDDVLRSWAKHAKKWNAEGKDVYVYFDNDQAGYAAYNAITLQRMLGQEKRVSAETRAEAR